MNEFTVEIYRNGRWETWCVPCRDHEFAEGMYESCHRKFQGSHIRLVQRTVLNQSQSEG
jgi:hypothetical protein